MRPVRLETARLVLDQPTLDDVDAIAGYCRDPLFERYLTTPWPYTREHAVGFVTEYVPSGWAGDRELTWAIRRSAELVGVVGITLLSGPSVEHDRPLGMIGFWMGAPHRGHGYLPEAACAAIDHVFADGLLERVEWEAVIPNRSSLGAARKLGFRYRGERAARVPARDGTPLPSWWAELGADDDRTPKPGWP